MRKVLSTLLALAMALTVFGGAAFAAEFNDMGVFPVVKDGEGIKLTVATPEVATITDYDNNHLTNYLRERMGVEIEVQLFDNAEYKTQLQLMTSSGAPACPPTARCTASPSGRYPSPTRGRTAF